MILKMLLQISEKYAGPSMQGELCTALFPLEFESGPSDLYEG